LSQEQERIARAFRAYKDSDAAHGRWSPANRGNQAALREREDATRRLLGAHGLIPLGATRVLEVGCGSGGELARLLDMGAEASRLVGVDILADRIEAGHALHPDLDLRAMNAERLDLQDSEFDLVMAITLFSSILDRDMARRVAQEITRVLKPGGRLLWYDFRYSNPRNPDVRGVTANDVHALFPSMRGELTAITLLPPLSRRLGPLTPVLYPALSMVPRLRTHLLGILQRGA